MAQRVSGHAKNSPVYGVDSEVSLFNDEEPWNMNNFTAKHSIINATKIKIPGIHTTFVNVGMAATFFAIHCEDSDLASMNILHFGAAKTWYCVPESEGPKLEKLLKDLLGNQFDCPTIVRHKCFLVPPSILFKYGIKFTKITQHAGEIIFTMYKAYHWGFNNGLNICESSNIASPIYRTYHANTVLCSKKCDYGKIANVTHQKIGHILESCFDSQR